VKTVKNVNLKHDGSSEPSVRDMGTEEAEKRFMDKVERELALPDYNLFSGSPSCYFTNARSAPLTSSRLCRDGDSVWLRDDLEHCMAFGSYLCLDQQLC
jgi:hypothetical protein